MQFAPPPMRLQDLPAESAHLCLGVERFCREDLNLELSGQSILIAYSGGADSKALLFIFHYLAKRLGVTLHVATLDHALRPTSAAEVCDAADVAARLGAVFHSSRCDVAALAKEQSKGLEDAGRIARLVFFEEIRRKTNCQWIATGHQLNDLAEDSLMRMVRGTGWPALAGMAAIVEKSHIIRPLLLTPRASLEQFLFTINVPWLNDAMNKDEAYLRNRVRHRILPLLLEENASFLDTVAERWRMAGDDGAFFNGLAEALPVVQKDGGLFMERAALVLTSPPIRVRKYIEILAQLGPGQVCASLVRALDAVWLKNEGGKTIQFSGNKLAVIRDGGILFTRKQGC